MTSASLSVTLSVQQTKMLIKMGNYAKILDKNSEICIIKVTEPTTPLILSCATRWDFFIYEVILCINIQNRY